MWNPLIFATNNGGIEMAKELVEAGADVMMPMEKGVTVFHMAAAANDVRILDFLIGLQRHRTLDLQTEDLWTPVQQAAFMGNMDALNLLLENGADPLQENNVGDNIFAHIVK